METNLASCNFTKYIKRGPNRWQHCPVVRGKTGRVKQDLVLVGGRLENHPEGYYSLDWREGGRRHRLSLGKDASANRSRCACSMTSPLLSRFVAVFFPRTLPLTQRIMPGSPRTSMAPRPAARLLPTCQAGFQSPLTDP